MLSQVYLLPELQKQSALALDQFTTSQNEIMWATHHVCIGKMSRRVSLVRTVQGRELNWVANEEDRLRPSQLCSTRIIE